jgi:hypothetical protein
MALESPDLLRPEHVAALQSSAGNKTVQGLFKLGRKKKPQGPGALTWQNTKWADTRFLGASDGGTTGVLFAGARGQEVVVKPGEAMDVEGGVASYMINQAAAAGGSGVALAPGYRVASSTETRQMEQVFRGLVPAAGKEKRVSNLIGKLSAGGVVVQDVAQGKALNEAIDDLPKHTKQRRFGGGRKLRADSPMRIFTDPRKVHSLGSVHAADMFSGNDDRLGGDVLNLENILVSGNKLGMIDNVMDKDKSYLRDFTIGKTVKTKKTADDAIADWKAQPATKQLAAGKFDEVAAQIFQRLLKDAPRALHHDVNDAAGRKIGSRGRAVDADAITEILKEHQDMFEMAFAAGLAAGRDQLVRSLNKLLQMEGLLEEVAGGGDLTEVRRVLATRRDFLLNGA